MASQYRLVSTTAFERDVRTLTKRNPNLLAHLREIFAILEEDPANASHHHPIKKLRGLKPGQGQWRIRVGVYRLRYDIFGREVVLYSFSHRKETY